VIVTVAHQKGGVGKTTTSVFLAHALAEATGTRCALIDADPHASASLWAQRAAESGHPWSVPVLAQPTSKLNVLVPGASNVVIDTPPADLDIFTAAIGVADLVLVPTSASALDLFRVHVTVDAAAHSGKPVAVLLTRTRRTRSVAMAEESLRSAGVRVLRTHIALREALAMAFGQPVRQLHGYDLATAELLDALPDQPYSVEAVRQRAAHAWAGHRRPLPAGPHQAGLGKHRSPEDPARSAPIGPNDDELIQRLKTSLARLAVQK
jgi:chromosome partitioning protein